MKKIKINMLSMADSVEGQGVGSAYLEQVSLVKQSNKFNIIINSKEKADIVHCHTFEPRCYYRMIRNKGVNVAYVHLVPKTLKGSIKMPKFALRVFEKYIVSFYKKADYSVVVNPSFKKDLIEIGLKEDKIHYIPNYVSKEKFHKLEAKEIEKLKKKYNLPKDRFIVLSVGQVQTRKGVNDFIECAKKLPEVTFVWCGGFSFGRITDGYAELKKIMENPPENVIFAGMIPREEMNAFYNMANLIFIPAYAELFPMVILEAINSDKPFLVRDLELYEDILFKDYLKGSDNEEFIKLIEKLKNDEKFYKKAEKKSNELSKFYSKEHVLALWEEFYTTIANKE